MGEVNEKARLVEELSSRNPGKRGLCALYVDALLEYRLAQANIEREGTVVFHPRTGSPIDNPYVRIRDTAAKRLATLKVRSDALWMP